MGDWVDDCCCMRCSGGTGESWHRRKVRRRRSELHCANIPAKAVNGLCISITWSLGTAAGAGTAWLELGANEKGHRGRKNNDQEELLSGVSFFIHY